MIKLKISVSRWRMRYHENLQQFEYLILSYNFGQNIWRLFHFLAQFLFTTSETELDYYHQKMNVRVASRVAERLKT